MGRGKIIEECQGAKSLLDVGCGTGYLLGALSILPDFYTAGIELNAQAAQFARRASGRAALNSCCIAYSNGNPYHPLSPTDWSISNPHFAIRNRLKAFITSSLKFSNLL